MEKRKPMTEDEAIAIARKYKPDLTTKQEEFVRMLMYCKKFGPAKMEDDFKIWPGVRATEPDCVCGLCVIVNFYKIKNEIINPAELPAE